MSQHRPAADLAQDARREAANSDHFSFTRTLLSELAEALEATIAAEERVAWDRYAAACAAGLARSARHDDEGCIEVQRVARQAAEYADEMLDLRRKRWRP